MIFAVEILQYGLAIRPKIAIHSVHDLSCSKWKISHKSGELKGSTTVLQIVMTKGGGTATGCRGSLAAP
jgi:hypothetical protein